MITRLLFPLAALLAAAGVLPGATASLLDGAAGRRVPDFSRAGYQRGDAPPPDIAVVTSVTRFGAKGDGETDDTKAIQAAIDGTASGAIELPPGRYKITDYIRITKPGIVLRGAGPDRTILWFPLGLDEVHPREMRESRGLPTSGYSFDGAFLAIQGDYRARPLARIVETASRGDVVVVVADASALRVGQDVFVHLQENEKHTLKIHLYSDDAGDIGKGKPLPTKMLVKIQAIDGRRITLDRPLRFETRAEWQPELRQFAPTVSEVGVEGIGFEFPPRKYGGHFKENGANAIELRNVAHCWVKDVRFHNTDLGVNVVACHNTIDGAVFTADAARETTDSGAPDCTGHHGFQCKNAEDNLITNFDFRTVFIHDLTVEHASGNVYSAGRGRDLAFDHHKDTPYENLFTDIDCGRGLRIWICGGGAGLGRQCAGYGTFWNIRAAKPLPAPPPGWGPKTMTFVGIQSDQPASTGPNSWWWQPAEGDVEPRNLHVEQVKRRRTGADTPTNLEPAAQFQISDFKFQIENI